MYNHEYDVYTALYKARNDKRNHWSPYSRFVAKRLHYFDYGHYSCLVYSASGYQTLSDISVKHGSIQRAHILRQVFKQLLFGVTFIHSTFYAHNSLNWSNIMINENYLVDPFITIVNFSLASRFKSKETDPVQLSRIPKRTVAFSPPEAYVDIDYDLQKSDTWSLMMVALAFYEGNVNGVGQILYGKFQAYTQPEYEQRMVELYHEYWGTEDKYVLHSSTYRMFDYISKAASTLFIVDVNARLTPTGYIDRYQVSHPKLY